MEHVILSIVMNIKEIVIKISDTFFFSVADRTSFQIFFKIDFEIRCDMERTRIIQAIISNLCIFAKTTKMVYLVCHTVYR